MSLSRKPASQPARLISPARRKSIRPAHGVARLVLSINGTPYSVRPIACDPAAALTAVRLRKSDGTIYHIVLPLDGHPVCDCADYVFHRDGIDPSGCKHVRALTAVGMLSARKVVAR